MTEWVDAWQAWWSGEDVTDVQLWGISITWWGRIGMLAQFLAALTIIAEIVGARRIRAFGRALRERPDTVGDRALRDGWRWSKATISWVIAWPGSQREKDAMALSATFRSERLFWLMTAVVIGVGTVGVWVQSGSWQSTLAAAFLLLVFGWLLSIVVTAIIVFLAALAALVIEHTLKPVAWFLEREAPDLWIKGGSILVLIVGFQFDLLAN